MNPPPAPGSTTSTLCPGSRLGSYEILQRLGVGGMGEVYRARDTRLGREVAIKTVSVARSAQRDILSRFEQEARSASSLSHPNIVTIYELGQVNGTHFIAMELVDGVTVREMIASGPVLFRKAISVAAQIADALAKAHSNGIVHRDLKPDNLMVSNEGTAKILDFGLAKLRFPDLKKAADVSTTVNPITEDGAVIGTVGYMSPEQANGSDIDFRSDQFSFGAVLYEMVSGQPAFQKESPAETLAAILRDDPELMASRTLQVPPPFMWILERCLAKDPARRYPTTRELARDLDAVRDRLADALVRVPEPRPNNLPILSTVFVGREHEAAALRALLEQERVRLVTLTGPGGIGKTRLALHVAREITGSFAGSVFFVPLAAVREAALIPASIAEALGLRDSGNQSPQEHLKAYLGGLQQPMLLLLDNFEHLVGGAPVVADLLSICPKLKAVVTSQAPLHLYGEHEFPVPPLPLPDLESIPTLEVLSSLPSVALFVHRAQAVRREFELTRENALAIAAICARLDGLPLAIELAAARVKLLPPSAMLTRLENSLNLLTGGARDLPTRQQTLRGTVDWSYSLLSPAEQRLFRRLSVFIGGCTLEGVEAVCDTKGDLGIDVFDGIASMVDKSLVRQVEVPGGDTRFAMLSTIREYAHERLTESGEEAATRRAHAAYFLVLAEEGAADVDANPEWLERFDTEHDNFRSALDHLIKTEDAEWGLRLGAALFRFWETREHLSEGREAIGKLLKLEGAASRPKLRARLLFAAAVLAGGQGDYTAARTLLETSLETCIELQDKRGVAVALNALGVNARDRGEPTVSRLLFERCVSIWRDLGDPADTARALSNLANVTKKEGHYDRAFSLYDECLMLFRQAGDEPGVAWTLNYQGDIAREKTDFVTARSLYEQSLEAFRRMRDGWGIASTLSELATLTCDQGRTEEAQRLYGESIHMFQSLGHKRGIARVLELLATTAAAQSRPERSLRLAGAAAALRQRLGAPLTPAEQSRLEMALEFARRALGTGAGSTAWMEGWAMPMDQAILEALGCGNNGVGARNLA